MPRTVFLQWQHDKRTGDMHVQTKTHAFRIVKAANNFYELSAYLLADRVGRDRESIPLQEMSHRFETVRTAKVAAQNYLDGEGLEGDLTRCWTAIQSAIKSQPAR